MQGIYLIRQVFHPEYFEAFQTLLRVGRIVLTLLSRSTGGVAGVGGSLLRGLLKCSLYLVLFSDLSIMCCPILSFRGLVWSAAAQHFLISFCQLPLPFPCCTFIGFIFYSWCFVSLLGGSVEIRQFLLTLHLGVNHGPF